MLEVLFLMIVFLFPVYFVYKFSSSKRDVKNEDKNKQSREDQKEKRRLEKEENINEIRKSILFFQKEGLTEAAEQAEELLNKRRIKEALYFVRKVECSLIGIY